MNSDRQEEMRRIPKLIAKANRSNKVPRSIMDRYGQLLRMNDRESSYKTYR